MFDCEFSDSFHLFSTAFTTEWILKIVIDEQSGIWGLLFDASHIDLKPGWRHRVPIRQRRSAKVLNLAFINRIAGVWEENTVSAVHQRLDELGDDRFSAGLNGNVFRAELKPSGGADVVGESGA